MKKNGGFTLIELLVAMGIMAVLTGMAAFNFNQSRLRARDVQRKNDLSQLQKSLELYRHDNNEYPVADGYQTSLMSPTAYIKTVFTDVRASEWVDYQYLPAADNKTYYLMTCLENAADSAKTTNETQCALFSDQANPCRCGHTVDTRTGVMYIISQP